MKDILKCVTFAVGFFAAISFTADAEDMAAVEQQAYMTGLTDGAREATVNRQCGWRDTFREPVKGVM